MQTQIARSEERTRAPVRRRARQGYIRTSVAAERAGVCEATILRWVAIGVLSGRKIVSRWWISEADLDRLLGD